MGRKTVQQISNNYPADQQVYGANQQTNPFAIQAAEEEATFSVVDNTRTSARIRGFGRGGGTVFGRGRGQRGGPAQRGGRGTFQRVGGRGGQQYDSRGGRGGGRGGRRFGWRDDKPQRNRDASVQVKPEWQVMEEIDFSRLGKLNLDTGDGEDLENYGFLYYYDRSYDKQPGAKTSERKLNVLERAAYNVTTSSDPILQELADKDEATVFATDNVLSMLMCATKSVYSWDLVFSRKGNKVFIDKRDGSNLDMVTVNENAADAPLEISEGNKDSINSPGALMLEATHINNVFPLQVVTESDTNKVNMTHEHPFYNEEVETDPPASKAYRYRRFDLSLEKDDEPIHLIVRTELDAVVKNNINGEDQYLTIKALNEFDNKAQGSGGALDWRSKLASQRGAVLATEMKNNSCKLARWAVQSILAKADTMKLGYVHLHVLQLSRSNVATVSCPVPTPRTTTTTSSSVCSPTSPATSHHKWHLTSTTVGVSSVLSSTWSFAWTRASMCLSRTPTSPCSVFTRFLSTPSRRKMLRRCKRRTRRTRSKRWDTSGVCHMRYPHRYDYDS
jgi:translation initiation factor 3 subunit D